MEKNRSPSSGFKTATLKTVVHDSPTAPSSQFGVQMVKHWFVSSIDFPSLRSRLPFAEAEGEVVELWLAKIGLYLLWSHKLSSRF